MQPTKIIWLHAIFIEVFAPNIYIFLIQEKSNLFFKLPISVIYKRKTTTWNKTLIFEPNFGMRKTAAISKPFHSQFQKMEGISATKFG